VTHDQVEAMTMGDRIAVLNAGVIQQLGAPQQLYDAPANLFVAGFIGSPAMNFFQARLVKAGEGGAALVFAAGGGSDARTVPLGDALAWQLAGQATTGEGRPVIVGVRPEHLHLAPADTPGALGAVVEVVEHLGNEQLLYAQAPGIVVPEAAARARESEVDAAGTATGPSVVARLDADVHVVPGERVALAVSTDHIHVFDPASTNRFV
jgi:multiple sugar transport system ATP-binding protein